MIETKFHKYQAIGNDYIVLDPTTFQQPLNPALIQKICNRNFGIGSDGILYGPLKSTNHLTLKIFNPDGSEAEKSGNGIRIFSRYLFDTGYIKNNSFTLRTKSGLVTVKRLNQEASNIQVDMGKPIFDAKKIPVSSHMKQVLDKHLKINSETQKINCVSMGNPHCVIFSSHISKQLACQLGPIIEKHNFFPNKTNVQFAKIIDPHNIKVEIWERGAGYTLASGSSSCAVVAVAMKKGLAKSPVTIDMPGGQLIISQSNLGSMLMQGSVHCVAYGAIHSDMLL